MKKKKFYLGVNFFFLFLFSHCRFTLLSFLFFFLVFANVLQGGQLGELYDSMGQRPNGYSPFSEVFLSFLTVAVTVKVTIIFATSTILRKRNGISYST